jgi:hypothetical protein
MPKATRVDVVFLALEEVLTGLPLRLCRNVAYRVSAIAS